MHIHVIWIKLGAPLPNKDVESTNDLDSFCKPNAWIFKIQNLNAFSV